MNRRAFIKRNGLWLTGAVAFPAIVRAQVMPSARRIASPKPSATGITYLIEQNCEVSSTPADWTDANSPTWGFTPAISGFSKSLRLTTGSQTTTHGLAAITTVEAYAIFEMSAYPTTATASVMGFRTSAAGSLGLFRVTTTGFATVFSGTDSTATVDQFALNTKYHVWLRFVSGGTSTVEFSTDGIRLGSGNKFTSKGSSTSGSAEMLRFGSGQDCVYKTNRILALGSSIGNNP